MTFLVPDLERRDATTVVVAIHRAQRELGIMTKTIMMMIVTTEGVGSTMVMVRRRESTYRVGCCVKRTQEHIVEE